MIKSRLVVFAVLVVSVVGCTDSVESVTREYRAATNEAIDAMTLITREEHARRMNIRVFKPLTERYGKIDKKLDLVKTNREPKDFVQEVLESDGVQIYLTDLIVNQQRYTAEIVRLKHVYKLYQERERELLIEAGDADPKFNPREVCPNLHELLFEGGGLSALRTQLTKPPLLAMINNFPNSKITDYDKMWVKFTERRLLFMPKDEIKLAH